MRTVSGSTGHLLKVAAVLFSALIAFPLISQQAQSNPKYAGFVMDAKTGKVLYARHADSLRYPASLTKMMTMYMMFDAFESGKLKKGTRIRFSKYAASRPPSKLGIKAGRSISAENAVLALATKSANDVATAVAEHLGGSESQFAVMMTRKARQLGMKRTTFKNASGLTAKGQLTTARDMARLGIALREHFPGYYKYFSRTSFRYGKNTYRNHNRLLGRVAGVDGIKTGYTRASGYNLVSSVQHKRRSIVAVVMGGRSGKRRNDQMQRLISKYLPRASRRKQKRLLAARKSTNFGTQIAELQLPSKGPVPKFRQQTLSLADNRIVTAHASTVALAAPSTRASTAAIKQRLAELTGKEVPSPAESPKQVTPKAVDKTTTATVKPSDQPVKPGGWHIQVGATDSKSSALSLLSKVQKNVPGVLANKQTYTETVTKQTATLYRARFVGFSSKTEARRACKAVKRRKYACLALQG